MTYRLRFRGAARGDVLRTRKWYEREAPNMLPFFVDELRSLVSSIKANPLMYPKVLDDVRRALMTRFAYAVYFTVDEDLIVVLAVMHQARDEGTWTGRMSRRE